MGGAAVTRMSAYPYSSSGPAVLGEGKSGGSWWKNTKDAIKKPWKWKAGNKDQKKDSPTDQWNERAFTAFPPLMAQLSPAVYQGERRSSYPGERTELSGGEQDVPEYEGQRRPRLDSIFPIHDTPPEAAEGGEDSPSLVPPGVVGNRLGGSKAVGRSSSFNETDCRQRRKESEVESQPMTSERRESIDSNNSEDRTLDRRKRRMGAVRQLPVLPKRSGDFDRTDVRSLPETSSYRQRRPTPVPRYGRGRLEIPQYYYGQPIGPPRGTPMPNFPHTPWGLQPDNLPTLSEESDDGIKGFDEFKMY